jgi:transcriptional regulator with XRE-family HTH domain
MFSIRSTGRYKSFLRLLKEARRAAGITQEQLATRMGANQSFVSKVERGERRLDVVELFVWCEALGTDFRRFSRQLHSLLKGDTK